MSEQFCEMVTRSQPQTGNSYAPVALCGPAKGLKVLEAAVLQAAVLKMKCNNTSIRDNADHRQLSY